MSGPGENRSSAIVLVSKLRPAGGSSTRCGSTGPLRRATMSGKPHKMISTSCDRQEGHELIHRPCLDGGLENLHGPKYDLFCFAWSSLLRVCPAKINRDS
jgi:hypothetical protein